MRVAGGFIPRLRSRKKVITALRDVVKYSHGPGHKCSGYAHPPLWGEDGLCNLLTGQCGKTGEVGEITEAIANPPLFM